KDSPKGEFVFFEGPPTANAKPALHHLEARAFKDVIPRYKTMQGFSVPRRAGWDTHGLPVELQIEKKLGLTSKKEIENYGIAAFNKECKDSVFTYIHDWEEFTDRIGYWVDKENAYYTFNNSYIESLWNIVGTVEQKGLLYKDYKIIPWCARCGTGLSSHELAQEYHDVKDLSVYAKFKVRGEENTFIVAWTTTPWTLPGNVALAVGNDIEYVKVQRDGEILILAKERLALVEGEYEIVAEMKGLDLVGLEYESLYPYLAELLDEGQKDKLQNAYKVYAADFVTTTDGTGVVHIAPMYGADDFDLGTAVGLPKFHTVGVDGKFITGCGPFEGRFVKDEDVAIDVIKDLAGRGLLFKKEKYEHSYPHCWRCKTPLIYYARDSWYIGMSQLSGELVAQNEHINWEPSHIKEGRFGEWLKNIKDWAISRERYWGTPLPIWVAEDNQRIIVDSVDSMKSLMKKSGNTYIVMRHGQTQHNVEGLWNYGNQDGDPLTVIGKQQVTTAAETLKSDAIDVIIASPFLRTLETAQVVAEALGVSQDSIVTDVRLAEWKVGGDFDGKPLDDFFTVRNAATDRYNFKAEGGESYVEVLKRAAEFMYAIEKEYSGKNILIISHGAVARGIELIAQGITYTNLFETTRDYVNFDNAEIRTVDFAPLPHNEDFELDLHRPYIDEVVLVKDGKEYTRIKEVMDVWFDSGAMPFAQHHYPFENKEYVESIGYPADFISEAIDQTRGWFYTLHAIGVLMGRGNAYKNAICLGHLLDEKGKKMSKSIGNIVDPWEQMAKYGVDTLRLWMYSVNQPGDSKNYDEKTVVELNRQVFGLLYNVLSFYELYRDTDVETSARSASEHVLDMWIVSRLNQFIEVVTESMDNYKTFEPVRALRVFMDDLSTWYVRRSRDRIKDSSAEAKKTLYTVLKTLSQLMAPFAPFAAEDIWQKLKRRASMDTARHDSTESDPESVHLSVWPIAGVVDEYVLTSMEQVRVLCTLGNALRKKVGVPVRQPLLALRVKALALDEEYIALVMDELNVKAVVQDDTLETEVELDLTMTDELKEEGIVRELMRLIQDNRKAAGLAPDDRIVLTIGTTLVGQNIITNYIAELSKTVGADSVEFTDNMSNEVVIDSIPFSISF
ncbi:class I tRNA ligase family protein, partial [Patescibacteria group bacterium]|nr:class I tRNA ligase family protein [Patescibacteria group bacterium]